MSISICFAFIWIPFWCFSWFFFLDLKFLINLAVIYFVVFITVLCVSFVCQPMLLMDMNLTSTIKELRTKKQKTKKKRNANCNQNWFQSEINSLWCIFKNKNPKRGIQLKEKWVKQSFNFNLFKYSATGFYFLCSLKERRKF